MPPRHHGQDYGDYQHEDRYRGTQGAWQRNVKGLKCYSASNQRQGSANPRQERALISERETRIRVGANCKHRTGKPRVTHGHHFIFICLLRRDKPTQRFAFP